MPTQLPQNFDPDSQEGNSWDLLPADEYLAQIVEASVQPPRNGDGYYVALTWRIIDGPYEGRQVWQRITYLHSSEQAQTIGRKALKDLCIALGVTEHVEERRGLLVQRGAHQGRHREGQDRRVRRQEQGQARPAA
jgi:hypothetical protein